MRLQVPVDIVSTLRAICLALPETREETAWIGTRWRVRKQTFAHVLMIDGGWPPAYAKAAGVPGPVCVLTFSSRIAGLDPLNYAEAPYFRPRWRPNIVGMTLSAAIDWSPIAELIEGSYCTVAPRKLAGLVEGERAWSG